MMSLFVIVIASRLVPSSPLNVATVTLSEEGSITFTCNHSLSDSRGGVLLEVDLRVPGGRASFTASKGVA